MSDATPSRGLTQEEAEELVEELLEVVETKHEEADEIEDQMSPLAASKHGFAEGVMNAINEINSRIYEEGHRI